MDPFATPGGERSPVRRFRGRLAAPVTLIGLMLVISLSWTPSPDYGSDKAARFLTLTVLATVAPFFLIDGERDVRRFLAWLVAVAVVAGAITLVNPPAEGGRLTIGSAGATNAALFAAHILALNDSELRQRLTDYRTQQTQKVLSAKL